MKIPDELAAYIEHELYRMIIEGVKTYVQRQKYKKKWDAERKRLERERDTTLKSLSKFQNDLDGKTYQELRNKYIRECENIKRKEGTSKQNPLKGKSTVDLNNYLYACYYLIKQQNPDSSDTEIYRLIEEKLAEKPFRSGGKTVYDYDNIREKIYDYKKMPEHWQNAFNQLIEDSYNRFLKNL